MFFGRKTHRRIDRRSWISVRLMLCFFCVSSIVGCDALMRNPATSVAPSEATPSAICTSADPALDSSSDFAPAKNASPQFTSEPIEALGRFWSFSDGEGDESTNAPPPLVRLPSVDALAETLADLSDQLPIGQLLPPRQIEFDSADSPKPPPTISAIETSLAIETSTPIELSTIEDVNSNLAEVAAGVLSSGDRSPPVESSRASVLDELTEQERQLAALMQESSLVATGVLTDERINGLAKKKIGEAYAMASRGALYVARQELIEVLRMISQAKDAQQGLAERTKALAVGLRALREAEDFAPRGTQLEAELDIKVLCASHRTPVANQVESADLLPRLLMDRYLRYAQMQLAMSVAGEPAGSMALHALGKLNSQLGRLEPGKYRLAQRHAIAYQQAALLAHNQNYLAAHELGVLLANSGHLSEAQQLLLQVAAREPNAVVCRNLARIQEELGLANRALANRDFARQLSQQGATGTNDVQWVSPQQFTQSTAAAPRYMAARTPTVEQIVVPGSRRLTQPSMRR